MHHHLQSRGTQMELKELKKRPNLDQNKKLHDTYSQFDNLLQLLKQEDLPEEIIETINEDVSHINNVSDGGKTLIKQIRKTQSSILKLLEKELKLVSKNHYRNVWLALGMAVFGIPLGVGLGASIGNMGLLGMGLPIGVAIGYAVGADLDQKALKEGRQLNFEAKF